MESTITSQQKTVEISELFKEIILTEKETALALYEARKKKYSEIKNREYWERVKAWTPPRHTATELYDVILKRANDVIPGFVIDEYNEREIKLLCQYFTQDPEFEKTGMKLSKGLLLFGNVGCGKTEIMRLFQQNQVKTFIVLESRMVAAQFAKSGEEAIKGYYYELPSGQLGQMYGHKYSGACFDDLGTETGKRHFGNASNVMADVILSRYNQKERLKNMTHITTNLTPAEIEEHYGNRVRSRMKEMFNVIAFSPNAPDRRK